MTSEHTLHYGRNSESNSKENTHISIHIKNFQSKEPNNTHKKHGIEQ